MKTKFVLFFFALFFSLSFVSLVSSELSSPIKTDDYSIFPGSINRTIGIGQVFEDFIEIENLKDSEITISFSFSGDVAAVVDFYDVGFSISAQNKSNFYFVMKGEEKGLYQGFLNIKGNKDLWFNQVHHNI